MAEGRRKLIRPMDKKKPLHIVFKSSHAKGSLSFLGYKNKLAVDRIIRETAKKFGVTVRGFENVGNHLHLLVGFTNRTSVQRFLRTVPALVARLVTGARKGKPFGKRFWDHLAFSRVISGRRDFAQLANYFFKNKLERESGRDSREAVEGYEEAQRQARRRKCDVWDVLEEWNRRTAAAIGSRTGRGASADTGTYTGTNTGTVTGTDIASSAGVSTRASTDAVPRSAGAFASWRERSARRRKRDVGNVLK